jgi:hypothetical protein
MSYKKSNEDSERVEERSCGFSILNREVQDVSGSVAAVQLILKMNSEYQTVDHRNKLIRNNHGTIFVRFLTSSRTGRHKLCE